MLAGTVSGSSSTIASTTRRQFSKEIALKKYSKYLKSVRYIPGGNDDEESDFINKIRKKIKIIPDDIK